MSTSLDHRAEAAAAAVRAAVADLEPWPGTAPPSRPRRWPVLVAAVVLVVAAVGSALALRDDGGDAVIAGLSDGTPPRLVVEDVPEGLEPAGAAELPLDGEVAGEVRFRLYARSAGDDPFADLGFAMILGPEDRSASEEEGRAVRVRGVEGRLGRDPASDARVLTWTEEGVAHVTMMTRSLSDEELLDAAEHLPRGGEGLAATPPAGYRLVADLDHLPGTGMGLPAAAAPSGTYVAYQSSDDERMLWVAGLRDEPGLLEAHRWLGGEDAEDVVVRGHQGWLITVPLILPEPADMTILAWREEPGLVLTVTAVGVSDEELVDAADSLRLATDAEWEQLTSMAEEADGAILAEDGDWRYSRDVDGGLCFEVDLEEGASGACSGPGAVQEPRLYEGAEDVDAGRWLHGRVPAGVSAVTVRLEGGAEITAEVRPFDEGGSAWAALVPRGTGEVTIPARADDGSEVDRTTVAPQTGWIGEGEHTATTTG